MNVDVKDIENINPMPKPRFCEYCRHFNRDFRICVNENSNHRSEIRNEKDKCSFWDEETDFAVSNR